MFAFLLWCILFVLCWPLAILALVAYPFIWLLLLPFRIIGVAVHGVLEVIYLCHHAPLPPSGGTLPRLNERRDDSRTPASMTMTDGQ